MARLFFQVLVFLDEKVNHPVWDLLDNIFNPNNNTYFYSKIFYNFCFFSWVGYNNTHPEEFDN